VSAQQKAQLGRVVRLLVFTLASSAVVVNVVSAWEVRYPLLGVAVGALEAMYRTAVPTVPAVTAVLAPAPGPGLGLPTIPPGVVESTVRLHPGTGVPMTGIEVPLGQTGTVSNPPAGGEGAMSP
jgi:hypothetical protein